MKKWSEIKQAILDKLFMEESEVEHEVLRKFQRLANESLNSIANAVKPNIKMFTFTIVDDNVITSENEHKKHEIITMPSDFLSHADLINYRNNKPFDELIYVSNNKIKVLELGNYILFYNATYPSITTEDTMYDNVLEIDESVLNCLPTYVAWNVLSQDEPERSMILKNEYELLLARLDTNIMYQEKHYRSEGGWY